MRSIAHPVAPFALLAVMAAGAAAATCPPAPMMGPTPLPPGSGEDLEVTGPCTVAAGAYHYGNVNIHSGGSLTFADAVVDFWAKGILIENQGALLAGTPEQPIGTNGGVLTIHLYGADQGAQPFGAGQAGHGGKGIICRSPGGTCGVPANLWVDEPTGATDLPGDVKDYFYRYHPLPYDDGTVDDNGVQRQGYFGYKVLALSYGGTLKLFGSKGATYGTVEASNSGTSWVRLARTAHVDDTTLVLDRSVDWKAGDQIVVTTTDYLPGHSEQREIHTVAPDGKSVTVTEPLRYRHNGERYPFGTLPARLGITIDSAETRAAVALLRRSIRIVSGGDTFGSDLPAGSFFGGHTIVRQGFAAFQVQGVEFQQLGQGGRLGHYPVHFHMARKTPADTFVQDCSVHDSMTRWYVVHATHGVTLARNVGYLSIGHGYYIEDGTEIDNRFVSNIGIFARAAVRNAQNPRQVPGILASPDAPGAEVVPYHSDYDHPAVFWIMNAYNDFQYNMAAGAGACGACFWLVPGSNSGSSRHQHWESYASLQNTEGRAGLTPLKSFRGNFCSSAMNSFNVVGNTAPCLGIGPDDANNLPAVQNTLAPASTGAPAAEYYPRVGGGSRIATRCDQTDCSTIAPCDDGAGKANCMVTVLDEYTSSFHWTETNFGAIWLRPHWNLVIDSVLTDVQNGGLTFVTGGDYTRSSNIGGNWMLSRRNVFVGRTQPDNPLASEAGPFNPGSKLGCDTAAGNNCLSRAEGVAFPVSNFGVNQRLFNVYDGPAFQDGNAYLDIPLTTLEDCAPGTGTNHVCDTSKYMQGRALGVPRRHDTCYLPHAAIGWKQPNGFYYPPAFQSRNLFFRNVPIRHFVIEPSFLPGTFRTDPEAVVARYCTRNSAMFDNFTAVDRQTVLNDVDGSLTGLADTTSVNEDPFFAAPVETVECASDESARTSPYEYVTTALYPACVQAGTCGSDWSSQCSTPGCYGVPLYRQYVTEQEQRNKKLTAGGDNRSIRLMGANISQRSSLTANHGLYYVDTTVGRQKQTAGGQADVNVFKAGDSYYLFLLYARPSTKQTYQLYVGKDPAYDPAASVALVRANIATAAIGFSPGDWPAAWTRSYDSKTGILTVAMDMSGFAADFAAARAEKCQPPSFCRWTGSQCVCALDPTDPLYPKCVADDSAICSWAGRDNDCPAGGCVGFRFTMAPTFATDPKPDPRPDPVPFPKTPEWNVAWQPASQDLAGDCHQPPVNYVIGTHASEKLVGTNQADIILGRGGNDRIYSRRGDDVIDAGHGSDRVWGGPGRDTIEGGLGKNRLRGGPGRDTCTSAGQPVRCR